MERQVTYTKGDTGHVLTLRDLVYAMDECERSERMINRGDTDIKSWSLYRRAIERDDNGSPLLSKHMTEVLDRMAAEHEIPKSEILSKPIINLIDAYYMYEKVAGIIDRMSNDTSTTYLTTD